jgi:hypothetical protein
MWPAAKWLCLIAVASLLLPVSACKKKPVGALEPATENAALSSPAGVAMKAALDKKDYDAAVEVVAKARTGAGTAEEHMQAMVLSTELRQKLTELSATDDKAAEALKAFQMLSTGR